MNYKVLLLAVFLTACASPGPDYLEPGKRYTVEQPLGHPAMSFKIPESGRWLTYVKDIEHIDQAITIDKDISEGFVTSMTLGMVEGTSDRIALEHRQSLKQFLIDGDMEAYFTRYSSKFVDGKKVKRVPGTYFEFNDIKCMVIGNFQPRKVAADVYLDGVMITCYLVVDGQLKDLFMRRSFAVNEDLENSEYHKRKQQAVVGSKDYDLDLIFPEDLKEIRDSIRIIGNKISQNYDDVEDKTIFDVPQRMSTGETLEEYKARLKSEGKVWRPISLNPDGTF
ncbi:hypothetical protein [Gilvimarinus chinensis]|uniref:hypothetical protein n=1 Tax=Gilvimarinus chinensis TaxID=396005 RepID=UPI00036DA4A6|nr:hypothetical protein [Gilvimarinus chinensis]